jgi:hypothetical protein
MGKCAEGWRDLLTPTPRKPGLAAAPAMRAALVLIAVLLSAFAKPATLPTVSIKRFGVVSVVADKFTRSYIGITAFTNKIEEIDVTSWGLDAAYADQLGKAAAAILSADYVAAPNTPGDFSRINQTNWRGASDGSSIEAAVKTSCAAGELDALLVISKDRGKMPGSTIERVPMGIQGGGYGGFLRLSAAISMYDCTTGHMQQSLLLRITPPGQEPRVPQVEISRDLMTHPLAEMDDKTRDEIKAKLLGLPESAWDLTLRRMVRK